VHLPMMTSRVRFESFAPIAAASDGRYGPEAAGLCSWALLGRVGQVQRRKRSGEEVRCPHAGRGRNSNLLAGYCDKPKDDQPRSYEEIIVSRQLIVLSAIALIAIAGAMRPNPAAAMQVSRGYGLGPIALNPQPLPPGLRFNPGPTCFLIVTPCRLAILEPIRRSGSATDQTSGSKSSRLTRMYAVTASP
jgi:hypothetical protein